MSIINYFRNDFARVRGAMLMRTNDKMPLWLSVVLYILLLPIGLLLMPFALLYLWYVKKQLEKLDE